jgi:hypothetical protein
MTGGDEVTGLRKVLGEATLVVAVMAALGAALYGWQARDGTPARVVAPEPGCDLGAGPCAAVLPDGRRLELAVTPRSLPLMEPLTFSLTVPGPVPGEPTLTVTGVNMDMGVQRASLEPAGEGAYQGRVVLPVCSSRRMEWQARVDLPADGGPLAVPFRFETLR